jgi:outer membrane protein assembly factor BamB
MKVVVAAALLLLGASSLAAQRFAEDSAPLQDPDVSTFMVFGDVALAIDYQGRGRVTAFINAYSLSKHTFLWHQEVQVQRTDEATGRYAMADHDRNLLYLGNGPLNVLDVTTGQVRWSLPCDQIGTVDLDGALIVGDGNLLIAGTKSCGDDDDRQVLLIDDRTGAIRWRAVAKALEYKTGGGPSAVKHKEFRWFPQMDNGQVHRVVLVGDKMGAVNYADGAPAWQVRKDVGRVADQRGGLMMFVEDKKLTAYRLADGTVAWTMDIDAPWAEVEPVPGSSDVIYFTYYAAFRADPATGALRYKARREHDNWSRLVVNPLFFMRTDDDRWGAYELASGARRWEFRRDFGHHSFVDTTIDIRVSPVVVIQGWKEFNYNTRVGEGAALWGLDAATGAVRWKITAVAGSPLSDIDAWSNQAVAVQDERAREWHLVNTADGSITDLETTAATASGQCTWVRYMRRGGKRLDCLDASGKTVWSRRGAISGRIDDIPVDRDRGYVVRPAKDGTVEMIRLTDGTSLFSTQGARDPVAWVAPGGGYILVPAGRTMKIITVGE